MHDIDSLFAQYPPMGWIPAQSAFFLRAPTAKFCEVVFRDHPDGERQVIVPMAAESLGNDGRDAWVARVVPPLSYYRFRVHLNGRTLDIADPWSTHVVRRRSPGHPAWSVCAKRPPFQWRDDAGVSLHPDDAVIYEAHVADITAHPSAGCRYPGTFAGMAETHPAAVGGLPHIMRLGVNAVQLLPVAAWPVMETASRTNHWGYMPSFFRAACDRLSLAYRVADDDGWVGIDELGEPHDPGDELRGTVRDLHARGMAVILDVVYNHVSLHDKNPLLLLDPGTWFRRERDGSLSNASGCGNDLATEDPDMRALILHTVAHWLGTYHVDGLRLDLAELIDDTTLGMITDVALELRPDCLLIAEPWSFRGHRMEGISELGYTVWNDGYRNTMKGQSPDRPGFVFGGKADKRVKAALAGSIVHEGGRLAASELSLNYLESHDDHTFGDFVRLALGEIEHNEVTTRNKVRKITGLALRIHKLAAATLFASRGPVMLAQGQCFGRAKVVGGRRGRLCGNSYDRPDATNHIDWQDRSQNPELVAWHSRWIALRKSMLLKAWEAGIEPFWLTSDRKAAIGYLLDGERPVAVLLNADRNEPAHFNLGSGAWSPLAGGVDAEVRNSGVIVLNPVSAVMITGAA
jgi:pullulanase